MKWENSYRNSCIFFVAFRSARHLDSCATEMNTGSWIQSVEKHQGEVVQVLVILVLKGCLKICDVLAQQDEFSTTLRSHLVVCKVSGVEAK